MAGLTMMALAIHPFEKAGLGTAPFRFCGMSEKVYVACQGAPVQPAGTCDFCGTGIRYCCHIQSHDGKNFIVGCDCVRRLHDEDNRLIGDMERAEKVMQKQKADAKRQAKWEAVRAAQEAKLAEQRERNGGLTDAEIAAAKRQKAEAEWAMKIQSENAWILAILERVPYASDFIDSITRFLQQCSTRELSDNQCRVLADIYGKATSGKTRASKEYKAKVEEFWRKAARS